MNFLHGTGHGVGHFLSVHEGPQSIRMNENPVVLQPGMVTSNEPGVYKAGKHGIRTENLTLVRRAGEGMLVIIWNSRQSHSVLYVKKELSKRCSQKKK